MNAGVIPERLARYAPGNLRLGVFAEFQLVEDVAGDPVIYYSDPTNR
jgi:hypothetical protein